jgi:hypothetical protein
MAETGLELARRHVRDGRLIVDRQIMIVSRLRCLGANSAEAEELLWQFERSQAIFEEHLAEMEKNLPGVTKP